MGAPPAGTMRAVVVPRHGGPEVLEVVERPIPTPGPGEVLVAVRAAGVNHLDTFVRRGMPGITLPLPMIPGSDAAGVIAAIGPRAEAASAAPGGPATPGAPAVGDRVFVSPG